MLAQEDMGSSSLLMPDKQGKLVRPRRFIHRVKIKYEIEEVLEPQESDIDFQEYDSTSATQSQSLASILSSTTPNPQSSQAHLSTFVKNGSSKAKLKQLQKQRYLQKNCDKVLLFSDSLSKEVESKSSWHGKLYFNLINAFN